MANRAELHNDFSKKADLFLNWFFTAVAGNMVFLINTNGQSIFTTWYGYGAFFVLSLV